MTYSYDRRAARPIPIDKSQARDLAKDIVAALPRHLKFRPEDMTEPLSRVRGFTKSWGFNLNGSYKVVNVKGYDVEVQVHVRAKPLNDWRVRKWVAGGDIKALGMGRFKYATTMTLYINSLATPQGLLDNSSWVEDELYSVIIHEVTHLRDVLLDDAASEPGEDADVYYNKPNELRAFMQQIVDEVLQHSYKIGEVLGAWGLGPEPDGRFVERALEQSTTWQRVRHHLKPEGEKLLLRAVVKSLHDEWPKLLEKYKEDDEEFT